VARAARQVRALLASVLAVTCEAGLTAPGSGGPADDYARQVMARGLMRALNENLKSSQGQGSDFASWPNILTENPDQRPEVGPESGPTLLMWMLRFVGEGVGRRCVRAAPQVGHLVAAVSRTRIGQTVGLARAVASYSHLPTSYRIREHMGCLSL
jgi:hypothetical protein